MRVVILYASSEGQTEKIAHRMAEVITRAGHSVHAVSADSPSADSAIAASEAIVVGGSIRYGHYPRAMESVVRRNRAEIDARPNAFFSVCMSAAGPNARPATAWGYVNEFIIRTGWQPGRVASFAGALRWSKYNPFIRFMMRIIVRQAGGDTDTSRDYEYTDWDAVERFAAEFELPLREPRAA